MGNRVIGLNVTPEELINRIEFTLKYNGFDYPDPRYYHNGENHIIDVPMAIRKYIDGRILEAMRELVKNLYTEEQMEKDLGLR